MLALYFKENRCGIYVFPRSFVRNATNVAIKWLNALFDGANPKTDGRLLRRLRQVKCRGL
jgi:hypothetical protein